MSQTTLESTHVGNNTLNAKISPLESTPVGAKTIDPKTLTIPTEYSKKKEKRKNSTYQRIWSQTQVRQTHHRENMIRLMTENTENQKANDLIKRKHIGSSRNRTRQIHFQVTLIRLTKVIYKIKM